MIWSASRCALARNSLRSFSSQRASLQLLGKLLERLVDEREQLVAVDAGDDENGTVPELSSSSRIRRSEPSVSTRLGASSSIIGASSWKRSRRRLATIGGTMLVTSPP